LKQKVALEEILRMIKDHPAFDDEMFDVLVSGGEVDPLECAGDTGFMVDVAMIAYKALM